MHPVRTRVQRVIGGRPETERIDRDRVWVGIRARNVTGRTVASTIEKKREPCLRFGQCVFSLMRLPTSLHHLLIDPARRSLNSACVRRRAFRPDLFTKRLSITCSGLKPLLREQSHRIQTYSSRINSRKFSLRYPAASRCGTRCCRRCASPVRAAGHSVAAAPGSAAGVRWCRRYRSNRRRWP